MCFNCLETWCSYCAARAVYLIVANGATAVAVMRSCRSHVDQLREDAARAAGVRPTITEIPAPSIMTGGPQ